MAKAYDLLVTVKLSEETLDNLRSIDSDCAALVACPRCGALAAERDLVTGPNGRVDFTASFARFQCGNFYAGGEGGDLGAFACSIYNLRVALLEAGTLLLTRINGALSRLARRVRPPRDEGTPAARILHGPATVYIGAIGDDPSAPTWHELGYTNDDIELR